ncbi:MAG: HAD-IA family hydrolase [Bacteroides stercoris]
MKYKNLFFDLDDTLWAFSLNARDTYEEMYWKYGYDRYFDSFEHYYSLYQRRNLDLWAEYADGKVTKEELNRQRYLYPLEAVGAGDSTLAKAYERDALTMIPTKSKLMPHAREVLNIFEEHTICTFFQMGLKNSKVIKCVRRALMNISKVVLSDDIGTLKPWPEIFHFALSTTQSELNNSLMIGDSWENDIVGAAGVGMHQVFYNLSGRTDLPFAPTYQITDLKDLFNFL